MKTCFRTRCLPLLAVVPLFLCPSSRALAATLYVKSSGSDANAGTTWGAAKATIGAAIALASSGDEIWVAAGTYPEHLHNRLAGGVAVNVALYGGFAGTETDRGQRDLQAHPTVIDGSGTGTCVTITDGAGPGTRVDGFVITRGVGGVSIVGSAPVIANNTIQANSGPGISVHKYQVVSIQPPVVGQALITGNRIVDNTSSNGAGIAVTGDLLTNLMPPPPTSPTITGNTIARNTASQNGGGIGCWGHTAPVIANNFVLANSASTYEVGWDGDDPVAPWIVGGGGIFATQKDMGGTPVAYAISAPSIRNNVVAANGALVGGGICLIDYPRLSEPNNPPPLVINNTVVANNGSGVYWGNTFPKVLNNIVAFNTWGMQQDQTSDPTVGFNDVYGNQVHGARADYQGMGDQTGLNGNISTDPQLAKAEIGEFHLQPGSPCLDAGTLDAVGGDWLDIDGQNRVAGAGVDIGADESDGTYRDIPTPIVYVRTSGSDAEDGSTWAKAKKSVAAGVAQASSTGGEVWVAEGTYTEHIQVPAFVYVYGGFGGAELNRTERDVAAHPTVLDGGGIPTVVLSRLGGYLVSALDGFTVRNGGTYRGNVVPSWDSGVEGRGGGIRSVMTGLYVRSNVITRNSLGNPFQNAEKRAHGAGFHGYGSHSILSGNTITENEALNVIDGSGGGLYFKLSMPTIEKNTLERNHAHSGSALYCILSIPKSAENTIAENALYNSYPLPLYFGSAEGAVTLDEGEDFLIERNVIRGNTAAVGAGINVKTNLAGRIRSNLIVGNVAYDPSAGGGMGGGIYALVPTTAKSNLSILNNTVVGNTATYSFMPSPFNEEGGGIAISLPVPLPIPPVLQPAKLVIANNLVAGNSSGIFQTTTTPMLSFTLEANDFFNVGANYRDVPAGLRDIYADPLFADPAGGNFRLTATSPCVDAGADGWGLAALTDLDGQPRRTDGNEDGVPVVDIGAYEYRVDPNADGDGDGVSNAEDAFPRDPAASVDTDGDGHPDAWNPGKSGADSTSQPPLTLDLFPNDPFKWTQDVPFEMPLQTGWNLVSVPFAACWHVGDLPSVAMPSRMKCLQVSSLGSVLAAIAGKYSLVRSFDAAGAHTYDPGLPDVFNDLTYLAGGYGYWIKMTEAATLVISSQPMVASTELSLPAGWNLVGYWGDACQYTSEEPPGFPVQLPNGTTCVKVTSVSDILWKLAATLDLARSFDANGAHTYDPGLPEVFNDLKYLSPGYGYWVKMKTAGTLRY